MNTYQVIDSGNFQKLEQVGPYKLVRPAPGAVWSPQQSQSLWKEIDAKFERFSDGNGKWQVFNKSMPTEWNITYGGSELHIQRTSFGHLGLFPEQAQNWQIIRELSTSDREFKVLNLFAYTGGSSLAAAQAGALVTHLDASKPSVDWAKNNARLNHLDDKIRWIVDDAQKFIERESRRDNKYDAVILDPPSFGRGSKNQVWKIEEHLIPFLRNIKKILTPNFKYILLSSHSQGYTPFALNNILRDIFGAKYEFRESEMTVVDENEFPIPSGACSFLIHH